MVFKADGGDMVRHYVYVDSLGIISPHEAIVGEALEQLSPCFDERGLIFTIWGIAAWGYQGAGL